jgi:hypothetical protein
MGPTKKIEVRLISPLELSANLNLYFLHLGLQMGFGGLQVPAGVSLDSSEVRMCCRCAHGRAKKKEKKKNHNHYSQLPGQVKNASSTG